MSGSVSLEYGFPSTHSTNAVSVALYGLLTLHSASDVTAGHKAVIQVLVALYSFSIVFGRLYCGMHGFLDVVVGMLLGAVLALGQWLLGPAIDSYVFGDGLAPILVIVVGILVLVRIHPEPADACPCFDDGVAFAAVTGGVELAGWHYSKTEWSWAEPVLGTVPYSFPDLGLAKSLLRVLLGEIVFRSTPPHPTI